MAGLREWIVRDWALKLTALALSLALWFAVRAETTTRGTIDNIPVFVDLAAEGWVLEGGPTPDSVSVEFEGPVRELVSLGLDPPRIVLPVESATDSALARQLEFRLIEYAQGERPDATRPIDIRPSTVRLRLDRLVTRSVPVSVPLAGTLPAGLRLLQPPTVEPAAVQVSGPSRRVSALDSIRISPIDLRRLGEDAIVQAAVDTAALAPIGIAPAVVTVRFAIGADRTTAGESAAQP